MKDVLDWAMYSQKNGISKAALENAMANYIGARAAMALSSGTLAIRLALRLAAESVYGSPMPVCSGKQESITGLSEERGNGMRSVGSLQGRHVFCPDLAPASLALPILHEGGEPVFIDISPCDWCMDPEALEIAFALYPEVKIVLMTHLYGFPGPIREIKDICVRHGAALIEDASDALGANIGGRMAGSFGDYSILDFGKGKIVSGNAGGMLLLNGKSGAVSAGVGHSHSYARADFHAMAESLAKRVLSELCHLPKRISRKKAIYENYKELLDGDLMYMNPVGTGTEPNYWMPCITCESAIPFRESHFEGVYSYANPHGTSSPMEIYDALRAYGIKSYPVYRPLSQQTAFRGCDQVSLDGSRYGDKGSRVDIWQDGREAEDIENAQNVARGINMANGLNAAASVRESNKKILDSTATMPSIFWERCDWSRQISNAGLCLPSDPGMTREEQEKVAGIIHACFDFSRMFVN